MEILKKPLNSYDVGSNNDKKMHLKEEKKNNK